MTLFPETQQDFSFSQPQAVCQYTAYSPALLAIVSDWPRLISMTIITSEHVNFFYSLFLDICSNDEMLECKNNIRQECFRLWEKTNERPLISIDMSLFTNFTRKYFACNLDWSSFNVTLDEDTETRELFNWVWKENLIKLLINLNQCWLVWKSDTILILPKKYCKEKMRYRQR